MTVTIQCCLLVAVVFTFAYSKPGPSSFHQNSFLKALNLKRKALHSPAPEGITERHNLYVDPKKTSRPQRKNLLDRLVGLQQKKTFTPDRKLTNASPAVKPDVSKKAFIQQQLETLLAKKIQHSGQSKFKRQTADCSYLDAPGRLGYDTYSYENNLYDCYIIDNGTVINLLFESMDIENGSDCIWDSLEIQSTSTMESYKYCGSEIPAPLSLAGPIRITFHTDGSVRRGGFVLIYGDDSAGGGSTPEGPCEVRPATEGKISYDNTEYVNHLDNCHLIDTNEFVFISFPSIFDIESSSGCVWDYLDIVSESTGDAHHLCGDTAPEPFMIQGPVRVDFHTDGSVTYDGFILEYSYQSSGGSGSGPEGQCEVVAQGDNISYNGTDNLYDLDDCYLIDTEEIVFISFTNIFNIESSGGCIWDFLDIVSESTGDALHLCGDTAPEPFTIQGPVVVHFHTNGSVTQDGFTLEFSYQSSHGRDGGPEDMPCGVPIVDAAANRTVGEIAPELAWPWQVSLRFTNDLHFCGGSIVAPGWVVTAAHCITNEENDVFSPESFYVVVGEHNMNTNEGTEVQHLVAQVIRQEQFNQSHEYAFNKDIALLRLDVPIEYNDAVRPACVPSSSVAGGTDCWTTGWGSTEGPDLNNPEEIVQTGDETILQQVEVTILTEADCSSKYQSPISAYQICAHMANSGTCLGDSGGPLVCQLGGVYYLEGATSFGSEICTQFPPVYASIGMFSSWMYERSNGEIQIVS